MLVEIRKTFVGYSAVCQNGFYFIFIQCQGLRRFFVFFRQFVELVMNVFHHFYAAVFSQGIFYNGLKCFHLSPCGHGEGTAQQGFHKTFPQFFRILGIVQNTVYICASVMEGWKQKSSLRQVHHPVTDSIVEGILFRIVA